MEDREGSKEGLYSPLDILMRYSGVTNAQSIKSIQ